MEEPVIIVHKRRRRTCRTHRPPRRQEVIVAFYACLSVQLINVMATLGAEGPTFRMTRGFMDGVFITTVSRGRHHPSLMMRRWNLWRVYIDVPSITVYLI